MASQILCSEFLQFGIPFFSLLGVLSHLLYFIHGELNKQAGYITFCFLIGLAALVLFFAVWCGSMTNRSITASSLFIAFQLSLAFSIATDRLLFHHVRRFPGLRRNALIKWASAYTAYTTQHWHAELRKLHVAFGDFVQTG